MNRFEASSTLMLRKIDLFDILVSKNRLRHRDMRKKVNLKRYSDTRDILVISKQANTIRKERISQKLVIKTKGPYRVL